MPTVRDDELIVGGNDDALSEVAEGGVRVGRLLRLPGSGFPSGPRSYCGHAC